METLNTSRISLRDFLHVVFKRKSHILLFFFATVCTVAIGSLFVKPTYEASSQILVKIGRENIYVPPSGNVGPVIDWNREEQINSEIELLRGQALAEKVVKSLGLTNIYKSLNPKHRGNLRNLAPGSKELLSPWEKTELLLQDGEIYLRNAVKKGKEILRNLRRSAQHQPSPMEKAVIYLQKALKVEGVKRSNVIEISFKHEDPQIAATVVNNLITFYLDRRLQVHKNPQSYKFFQDQSQVVKNKLRQAEGKLEALKKRYNVTSIAEEQSLLLKHEADLRTDFNKTLSQEAETENRIREVRQQLATTPKTISQGEEIDHNPYLINTLQARLVELELREKELLAQYTEQSRLVQNVREEIQMVGEKLAEQETRRYGRSRSGPNPTYQRLQEELFRNEAELKALTAKIETQSVHLADYRKKLEELSRIEVELKALQDEVDLNRQKYRLYLTKFEDSRISNAMDREKIASVSLIESARPPARPVSPKVSLNMLLAVFLGGFGGLGLAFFLEYLDDSLEKPEDVEDALEIPVLASIPEMKK